MIGQAVVDGGGSLSDAQDKMLEFFNQGSLKDQLERGLEPNPGLQYVSNPENYPSMGATAGSILGSRGGRPGSALGAGGGAMIGEGVRQLTAPDEWTGWRDSAGKIAEQGAIHGGLEGGAGVAGKLASAGKKWAMDAAIKGGLRLPKIPHWLRGTPADTPIVAPTSWEGRFPDVNIAQQAIDRRIPITNRGLANVELELSKSVGRADDLTGGRPGISNNPVIDVGLAEEAARQGALIADDSVFLPQAKATGAPGTTPRTVIDARIEALEKEIEVLEATVNNASAPLSRRNRFLREGEADFARKVIPALERNLARLEANTNASQVDLDAARKELVNARQALQDSPPEAAVPALLHARQELASLQHPKRRTPPNPLEYDQGRAIYEGVPGPVGAQRGNQYVSVSEGQVPGAPGLNPPYANRPGSLGDIVDGPGSRLVPRDPFAQVGPRERLILGQGQMIEPEEALAPAIQHLRNVQDVVPGKVRREMQALIDGFMDDFPDPATIALGQKRKKYAQDQATDLFNKTRRNIEVSGAEDKFYLDVARGYKEALEKRVPGLHEVNKETQVQYALYQTLLSALNKESISPRFSVSGFIDNPRLWGKIRTALGGLESLADVSPHAIRALFIESLNKFDPATTGTMADILPPTALNDRIQRGQTLTGDPLARR